MLSLGILSIVQALILPGFIITYLVRNIRWFDRLLLAVPLSLICNYSEVLLLILCNAYHRSILIGTVIVEVGVIVLLTSRGKRSLNQSQVPPDPNKILRVHYWYGTPILIVSILICFSVPFLYAAWREVGTVFNIGDAILSWNKWAVMWYHGEIPHATWQYPNGSWTYPQGIPILYSLTYIFIGDERVQIFAKIIAIAFPLFAFATFIRMAFIIDELRAVLLLGLSIFIWMLSHGYGDLGLHFTFGGYVDAAMAYFGVFSAYIFLLLTSRAMQSSANVWKDTLIYIAIVAVSASALVKQTGVLLTAIFLAICYLSFNGKGSKIWKEKKAWWGLLFVSILVTHWYVFKAIQIYYGYDESLVSLYNSIIPGNFLMRPVNGMQQLFVAIGWMWLPALLFGLMNPYARKLAYWALLPIFMFWGFFASWDLRALFLAFPWIAIILAVGSHKIFQVVTKPHWKILVICWLGLLFAEITHKSPALIASWVELSVHHEQIPIQFIMACLFGVILIYAIVHASRSIEWQLNAVRVKFKLVATALAIVILASIALTSTKVTQRLISRSIEQEQEIGHTKINRFLLEYFANSNNIGANEYVATAEQYIGFVPGLKEHYKFVPLCEDFSFLTEEVVKYYLYIPDCPASAKEHFEKMVAQKFSIIRNDPTFVLYKIAR